MHKCNSERIAEVMHSIYKAHHVHGVLTGRIWSTKFCLEIGNLIRLCFRRGGYVSASVYLRPPSIGLADARSGRMVFWAPFRGEASF